MSLLATCSAPWAAELAAHSRARLRAIAAELDGCERLAAGLVGQTRWHSEAARGFHDESDAILAEFRRLEAGLDDLDALLAATARVAGGGCG